MWFFDMNLGLSTPWSIPHGYLASSPLKKCKGPYGFVLFFQDLSQAYPKDNFPTAFIDKNFDPYAI